jgi:hypothetical protein
MDLDNDCGQMSSILASLLDIGLAQFVYTRAVWKVCGLVAVHCCYAEGGGDFYVKL